MCSCFAVIFPMHLMLRQAALQIIALLQSPAGILRYISASTRRRHRCASQPCPKSLPQSTRAYVNDDLEQMLALPSMIDDYIGVSNTNMHLCAAVGRSARVPVPSPAEWRWMAAGR